MIGLRRVVTLCGSTKFREAFESANAEETLAGRIVLSVGFFMHQESREISEEQKTALDQLHLEKIDCSDEILVLNVDGYVGDSTRNEINYAREAGKRVRWLERPRRQRDGSGG